MSGKLIVSPLQAQLTRDTETFGKMDPYVVVVFGSQSQKSSVCSNGGKTPSWKDTFTFQRTKEELIVFQVWDHDTISKNDMAGEGVLAFSRVASGKFSDWVELSYKGKPAGKILINAQFMEDVKPFPKADAIMGQGTNHQNLPSVLQTKYPTFPEQSMPTQTTYPHQSYPIGTTTMIPQQTYTQQQNYAPQSYRQESYAPQQNYTIQPTTYTAPQTYPVTQTMATNPVYPQQTYIQPTVMPIQQTAYIMQPTLAVIQQPICYQQMGTAGQPATEKSTEKKSSEKIKKKKRFKMPEVKLPIIGKLWEKDTSSSSST